MRTSVKYPTIELALMAFQMERKIRALVFFAKVGSILWSLLLVLGSTSIAVAQFAYETTKVEVSSIEGGNGDWKVVSAEVREQITGAWDYLQMKNISQRPVRNAIFYAEYFDGSQRFCFSGAFSLADDIGNQSAVDPGEVRELYALDHGLSPISEPKTVRLYVLSEASQNSGAQDGTSPAVRTPPTLAGGTSNESEQISLSLPLHLAADGPTDFVLGRVEVDESGHLGQVTLLNSADAEAETWFYHFVQGIYAFPATEDGRPKRGSILLLIQVVADVKTLSGTAYLPRKSPWVEAYLKHQHGNDALDPVTTTWFQRPATKIRAGGSFKDIDVPPAPLGEFQLWFVGSEWGAPATCWVDDPSTRSGLRRGFRLPGVHCKN